MVWLGEEQTGSGVSGEVVAKSRARSSSALLYAMGRFRIGGGQPRSQGFGV